MATTITLLDAIDALAAGDLFAVDDLSENDTRKVSGTQILNFILSQTLTSPRINEAVALTATSTELNQLDGVEVGGEEAGDIITNTGLDAAIAAVTVTTDDLQTQITAEVTNRTSAVSAEATTRASGDAANSAELVAHTAIANAHNMDKSDIGLGNVPNTDFTTAVTENTSHRQNTSNPHGTTKAHVGLANVPNTDFTAAVNANTTHQTTIGNAHSATIGNILGTTGGGGPSNTEALNKLRDERTLWRQLLGSVGLPHIGDALLLSSGYAQNTWHLAGPPGTAGVTAAWTALNNVPANAAWIRVRIRLYGQSSSGAANQLASIWVSAKYPTGTANEVHDGAKVGYGGGFSDASGRNVAYQVNEATLPIDSFRRVSLAWYTGFSTANVASIALIGWGFNTENV